MAFRNIISVFFIIYCCHLLFPCSSSNCPSDVDLEVTDKNYLIISKVISSNDCLKNKTLFDHLNMKSKLKTICGEIIICETNTFSMKGCDIQEIEPFAFNNSKIFNTLQIKGNNISVIRSFTFVNLNLKYIFLSNNSLRSIEVHAFVNISVQFVTLSDNWLTKLNGEEFLNVLNVQTFMLRNNEFNKTTKNMLKIFQNSSYKDLEVDLSFNFINTIDNDTFFFLKNKGIKSIYLNKNELSFISEDTFDMISLRNTMIVLGTNLLRSIPKSIYTQQLNLLNIEKNCLNSAQNLIIWKWSLKNHYDYAASKRNHQLNEFCPNGGIIITPWFHNSIYWIFIIVIVGNLLHENI